MDIILRVIVNASKEASVCEEILLLSHIILTKVGPKGRNIVTNHVIWCLNVVSFFFKALVKLCMIVDNSQNYHPLF